MINNNDYSNPYDKSNDKINSITKMITLLPTCLVIKTTKKLIVYNSNNNN